MKNYCNGFGVGGSRGGISGSEINGSSNDGSGHASSSDSGGGIEFCILFNFYSWCIFYFDAMQSKFCIVSFFEGCLHAVHKYSSSFGWRYELQGSPSAWVHIVTPWWIFECEYLDVFTNWNSTMCFLSPVFL